MGDDNAAGCRLGADPRRRRSASHALGRSGPIGPGCLLLAAGLAGQPAARVGPGPAGVVATACVAPLPFVVAGIRVAPAPFVPAGAVAGVPPGTVSFLVAGVPPVRASSVPAVPVSRVPPVPGSPLPVVVVPGVAVPALRPRSPRPPRPAGECPPMVVMAWPRRRSRPGARRGVRGGGDGRRHRDGGVPGPPGVMPRSRERCSRPRCRCRRRRLRRGRQGLLGPGVPHRGRPAAVGRQVDGGYRAADDERRHDDQGRDSGAEADVLKPGVHGRAHRRGPVAAGLLASGNHKQDDTDVSSRAGVLSAISATGVASARLAWRRAHRERWTA
jgi:hypothetical protein